MRGSLELRVFLARKLFSRLAGRFLIYFEIFESKTAVRMRIYLTALERTDTVVRFIDQTQEKERCTYAESSRFDRVATSFLHHFMYIYSVKIIQKHSRRMGINDIYELFHVRFTIKILINLKILFLVLERKKNDTYFFFQYDM